VTHRVTVQVPTVVIDDGGYPDFNSPGTMFNGFLQLWEPVLLESTAQTIESEGAINQSKATDRSILSGRAQPIGDSFIITVWGIHVWVAEHPDEYLRGIDQDPVVKISGVLGLPFAWIQDMLDAATQVPTGRVVNLVDLSVVDFRPSSDNDFEMIIAAQSR
jgi:hypothetical protein